MPISLRCSFFPGAASARSPRTALRHRHSRIESEHLRRFGSLHSEIGMRFDRRTFVTGLSAVLLAPRGARAATVTDGAGRSVPVPARVERVFPAGPPAAIMLYTLAPQLLLGWPRPNRAEERGVLLPDIGEPPGMGRITGRGT